MTVDLFHTITWAALALSYAMGLTTIFLQIRGRRRPGMKRDSFRRQKPAPGGQITPTHPDAGSEGVEP